MDESLSIDNMWIPIALCMVLRILDCILRWPSLVVHMSRPSIKHVIDKLYTVYTFLHDQLHNDTCRSGKTTCFCVVTHLFIYTNRNSLINYIHLY